MNHSPHTKPASNTVDAIHFATEATREKKPRLLVRATIVDGERQIEGPSYPVEVKE